MEDYLEKRTRKKRINKNKGFENNPIPRKKHEKNPKLS